MKSEKSAIERLEDRIRDLEEKIGLLSRSNEELAQREEKFRLIAENTSDFVAVCTFAPNPVYTYVSPSHRSLGYEQEELVGRSGLELIHPEDRKKLLPLLKRYLGMKLRKTLGRKKAGVSESLEFRIRDKQGNWHLMESTVNVINEDRILFVSKDETDRKKAEESLRRSEAELRRLSSQLLLIRETERKRMAQELHDGIGQSLLAVKYRVEFLQEELSGREQASGQSLGQLVSMVQDTIEEVRRLSRDLRPPILDDFGIVETVSWLCQEFETTHPSVRVEKDIRINENRIPVSLRNAIYRILQEALHNISKHSQAGRVTVRLSDDAKGRIELIVDDNGVGFDAEVTLQREETECGFGLTSMEKRAELSGGTFRIESSKGSGTVLSASWQV